MADMPSPADCYECAGFAILRSYDVYGNKSLNAVALLIISSMDLTAFL